MRRNERLCTGFFEPPRFSSAVLGDSILFSGLHQPDLWLVVIVLATLIFDNKTAMTLALVGGLLTDLVTGNLFGLHLLPYLVIAALYLALGRKRYNRHWYISLFAMTLASLLYALLSWLVLLAAGSRVFSISYILYFVMSTTFMNGAAVLFLHRPLWAMKREGEPKW